MSQKQPVRPDLLPLDDVMRNELSKPLDTYDLDIYLHYLQTGEVSLDDLPGQPQTHRSELERRYSEWLTAPDPAEEALWRDMQGPLSDPFGSDNEQLLKTFIDQYPDGVHSAEALERLAPYAAKALGNFEDSLASTDGLDGLTVEQLDSLSQSLMKAAETARTLSSQWSRYMTAQHADRLAQATTRVYDALNAVDAEKARRQLQDIQYDYDALVDFARGKAPNSPLFRMADDMAWQLVSVTNLSIAGQNHIDDSRQAIDDFLRHMPQTHHRAEAVLVKDCLKTFHTFDDDIIQLHTFLQDNPDSPLASVVDDRVHDLVRHELSVMQANPAAYSRQRMLDLIDRGLVTEGKLISMGLATEKSIPKSRNWETFTAQHGMDNIQYIDSAELESDDVTDVYLFGVPSTGKTCVLIGLLGSTQLNWNSAIAAGEYGDILSEFRENMLLPQRTAGKQFFCINGKVTDDKKRDHKINLIELAGEDFLDKIAKNSNGTVSLADMDSQAVDMLNNDHRKIFFLVMDPTVTAIEYTPKVPVLDSDGVPMLDAYGEPLMQKGDPIMVQQKTIIKKMVDILRDPVNAPVMEKVDALHFILTKSDVLELQNRDVRECIEPYKVMIDNVRELCEPRNMQINEATGFKPRLYTFSLGKFYVGQTFDYDSTDSDKLLDVITQNTIAVKRTGFMNLLVDKVLNKKVF